VFYEAQNSTNIQTRDIVSSELLFLFCGLPWQSRKLFHKPDTVLVINIQYKQ